MMVDTSVEDPGLRVKEFEEQKRVFQEFIKRMTACQSLDACLVVRVCLLINCYIWRNMLYFARFGSTKTIRAHQRNLQLTGLGIDHTLR